MNKLLDKATIHRILNLQGSPLIDEGIARRQQEVIRKGFNYLLQEGTNALYIADEVGLGKTYIALGIASLLRHFSPAPEAYQDVIIVPKENLQYKWEKEIKQFIKYNYLQEDNRVKSVLGSPVGEIAKKDVLQPLDSDHPAYHLYRNSQFSLGLLLSDESRRAQLEKLSNRLTLPAAREMLEKAYERDYFLVANKSRLKKLYAYLLSICNPSIELLIVDEGHNYKQGLGFEDDDSIADRNQVVARFFGLKRNSEEDQLIFAEFPELAPLVKPRVQKLIVLSATPKTASLLELKNQFDLFLKSHLLSGLKKEEEVKARLNQFLIRGNMEYAVGETRYTRNLCRQEHRSGGVDKKDSTKGLHIESHEQAIVLGLLQYKTIKHLGTKHNASFELGMLAGFETFRLDQEKRSTVLLPATVQEQEYEEVRTRKTRTSQDYSVLKSVIESYRDHFNGELPPHPKQDALVDATFNTMRSGEKSLIFVRRVASADELERRLLDRWESVIHDELKTKWKKKLSSQALTQLIDSYTERKANRRLSECIDSIFSGVVQKLLSNKALYPFPFLEMNAQSAEEVLQTGLHFLYANYLYFEKGEAFQKLLNRHCDLSIIKTELVQLSFELLLEHQATWLAYIGVDDEEEEGQEAYYFHSYFKQPHAKLFKKRTTATDWFDVNFYLLNQAFQIAGFDKDLLVKNMNGMDSSVGVKEVQETFLKCTLEDSYASHFLNEEELPSALTKNTLLTQLLLGPCREDFEEFLQALHGKRKIDIWYEVKVVTTILKSCLRNGSGFVPLYIADKAEGEIGPNYLSLLTDVESLFHLVLKEAKIILQDYAFLRAVNFPEGETFRQMESKLYFQTPVLGLTGQSTRSKSNVATQFRMPGFPYVLITTDIFREGEDLHAYCQNIYHYGIAWNCSDMEQRTGRIDRINSLSHRKLLHHQLMESENQIHVFYPYLKNTLEVNQVSRLFHSINSFTETFNDFTQPVNEEGMAYTGEKVEEMPTVVKEPLRSKYDHEQFTGYEEKGAVIKINAPIGMQKEALLLQLQHLQATISEGNSFNYGPHLDTENFTIKGDMVLINRENRRGPFRIMIKNAVYPGRFVIEVSAYLFKISSKAQRLIKTNSYKINSRFTLGSLEDFYVLTFSLPVEFLKNEEGKNKLFDLLQAADTLEKELTNDDVNVFG